jgi:hypothetical protein
MTRSDQHKLIQELKYHVSKMSREDLGRFEMMLKRDKDDEDLDVLSVRDLEMLYGRYIKKKSKQDIEEVWKKMTGRRE